MRLATLASGSKANAAVIEVEDTRLLIDCGLGPRILAARLRDAGVAPSAIDAVIVTHEHSDHVRGLAQAMARWPWPVVGTPGTLAALRGLPADRRLDTAYGAPRAIGACTVELAPVPHDAAEPAAVLVTATRTGARAAVATDLGEITDALAAACERVDYLIFESNHDEDLLRNGPYPAFLQERILSGTGHLSNRQTSDLLARVAHRGLRQVLLAHLSEPNNDPRLALSSARYGLQRAGGAATLRCAAPHAVTWPEGAGG